MVYLILASETGRVIHISNTLSHQDNGYYLIYDGTLAIPPSICELAEVDIIPDGVEPEKWCYVDGKFVPNLNWVEPQPETSSADIDYILDVVEGKV